MAVIRVGMIRCDVHACWYGLLFAPADEHCVLSHLPQCHHYFYYGHKVKFGPVPGFELTKLYDPFPPYQNMVRPQNDNRSNAEILSAVFMDRPKICSTLEEVSDNVDLVFIADANKCGEDHLELATPGLKNGIPTFVDKPFAHDLTDARAMVELAQEHDTPLMSASLLSVNPYVDHFRNKFAEIAPVGMGIVKGVGFDRLSGIIHGLSLAQNAFGAGVAWVQSMGTAPLEFVRLHYAKEHPELPNGKDVMVISSHLPGPHCGYHCEAYSRHGAVHSEWIDDYKFPLGGLIMMEKLRKLVETREPQISYATMLEVMEIVEAGRFSHANGSKPVSLAQVR